MKKDSKKLRCDWKHQMHAMCTTSRPNLMLENQDKQKILIVDILCANEANKTEKRADEIQKY